MLYASPAECYARRQPGPFVTREIAALQWRLSVLAALDGLAGGPALIRRDNVLDYDRIETGSTPPPAMLTVSSSAAEIERALDLLQGHHELLPRVVTTGAVIFAANDPLIVSLRTSPPVLGHYQIFWADKGEDFSESASVNVEVALTRVSQPLRFVLPRQRMDRIRIDPINVACVLRIEEIRLTVGGRDVCVLDAGARLLDQALTSGLLVHPNDPRLLIAVDDDPTIVINAEVDPARGELVEVDVALSAILSQPDLIRPDLLSAY